MALPLSSHSASQQRSMQVTSLLLETVLSSFWDSALPWFSPLSWKNPSQPRYWLLFSNLLLHLGLCQDSALGILYFQISPDGMSSNLISTLIMPVFHMLLWTLPWTPGSHDWKASWHFCWFVSVTGTSTPLLRLTLSILEFSLFPASHLVHQQILSVLLLKYFKSVHFSNSATCPLSLSSSQGSHLFCLGSCSSLQTTPLLPPLPPIMQYTNSSQTNL